MEFRNPPLRRQMTKEQIQEALDRLGQILRARRVAGEIAVFGGAALVLGFDFRRATQDMDALVTEGHGQVMQAAQEVEKELSLPPNWLNEQATSYLSKHPDFDFFKTYPLEGQFGLRVMMAKPEYLLAMKLLAFRLHAADVQDIVYLSRRLNRTSAEDLLSLLKHYYPDERISPEREVQIRDLARQINAPQRP
jgi:Nucleotidyltransferase of unknown function (DUF6036)